MIPQKNRLEKCRLAVKSVFENIDFWGSYGLNSAKKWPKSPKQLKMPIFWHFLVHNFPKNQYFQKPISLPIYIFQGGSSEQGRIQDFFQVGAGAKRPKIFFRTQVRNCFAPTLFAPTPLFAFLSSWTNFKKFLTPSTPTPLFAFLPFWTNFNFAHKTHESGTEQENLGGQAD